MISNDKKRNFLIKTEILIKAIFALFLLPYFSFSQEKKPSSSPLNFVTENIKKSYACLTLDCERGPVPEILKLAQMQCELEKVQLGCSKITDEDPEDAPYIRSCNFKKICERQLMPQMGLDVTACLKGAADLFGDYYDYLRKAAYIAEESYDRFKIEQARILANKIKNQECKDVACKRELTKGIPEFDSMDDKTLNKYPMPYIRSKVSAYLNYISSFKRIDAAKDYFNNDEARKRFEEEFRKRTGVTVVNIDFIALGKHMVNSAGIILDCYDDHAYAELLCQGILKAVLPAGAFKVAYSGIKSSVKLMDKVADSIKAKPRDRRIDVVNRERTLTNEHSFVRQLFIEKFSIRNFTTPVQNAYFMKMAESFIPIPGRIFVRIENGFLKSLNDTIKDRVLITSANNKYNEIIFRKLDDLKKEFPDIEFHPYQGFKEAEFFAKTKEGKPISPELMKSIDKKFQDANVEFKKYLDVNNLLRATDQPETWFRAGVGRTGDMANAAARGSRDDLTRNILVNYDDPIVLKKLEGSISEGRRLSDDLTRTFANSEMVTTRDGVTTLNSDVFGMVRKFANDKDPDELRKQLQLKYPGQKISAENAEKIRQLYEVQDRFSPPVRFVVRENASFTLNPGTQVGADFVNAGGDNAAGNVMAMMKSKDGSDMLKFSRVEYENVTKELDRKKAQFISISEDLVREHNKKLPPGAQPIKVTIAKSGDDSVASFSEILTKEQKDYMAKEWARRESALGKPASSARLSIPSERVVNVQQKNILANHGESIEKSLRQNLNGKLTNGESNGIVMKIEMKGHKSGTGYVDMTVHTANGKKLTSDQWLEIQKQFKKAVQNLNENSGKDPLRYSPGEIKLDP